MKQKYELVVILKALLPEDVRLSAQSKIEGLVKTSGGKIEKTDVWGKKHLAYRINKHDEGYYILYRIELERSKTDSFRTNLGLIPELLRYLLIKEEEL
ncbi:MAG: 30S ribosomal protein S6 [bacterium]